MRERYAGLSAVHLALAGAMIFLELLLAIVMFSRDSSQLLLLLEVLALLLDTRMYSSTVRPAVLLVGLAMMINVLGPYTAYAAAIWSVPGLFKRPLPGKIENIDPTAQLAPMIEEPSKGSQATEYDDPPRSMS
jgi:hypothetical protein